MAKPSRLREVDVVIHIGAPKTGSSAIQRFCMNNRQALLNDGFYYPKHAVDKNGVSGGHSVLATMLRRDKLGLARLYFRYLLLLARLRGKTLLLSSEGFSRSASRFAPLLEGLNVRVVGWFRHPIEAFVSNYNQSIKRHYRTETVAELFETISRRRPPPHLSGKRLNRWADFMGDAQCTFLPYLKRSDSVGQKAIERVWLEVIGVPDEALNRFQFDAKRVNRSYVPDALELKRLLNGVLKEDGGVDAQAIDWALQDYSDNAESQAIELGVHLEPEHVQRLSDIFTRSNRRLAKRFPSMEPLLEKDSAYLHQAQSSEDQAQDLSAVLAHLERLCPDEVERVRVHVKQRIEGGEATPEALRKLARWLVYRGERLE